MAFWGVSIMNEESYTYHNDGPPRRLRITQATLADRSGMFSAKSVLECNVGGKIGGAVRICSLSKDSHSIPLDLEFEEESQDIVFSVRGPRGIHLSGYYVHHHHHHHHHHQTNNKLDASTQTDFSENEVVSDTESDDDSRRDPKIRVHTQFRHTKKDVASSVKASSQQFLATETRGVRRDEAFACNAEIEVNLGGEFSYQDDKERDCCKIVAVAPDENTQVHHLHEKGDIEVIESDSRNKSSKDRHDLCDNLIDNGALMICPKPSENGVVVDKAKNAENMVCNHVEKGIASFEASKQQDTIVERTKDNNQDHAIAPSAPKDKNLDGEFFKKHEDDHRKFDASVLAMRQERKEKGKLRNRKMEVSTNITHDQLQVVPLPLTVFEARSSEKQGKEKRKREDKECKKGKRKDKKSKSNGVTGNENQNKGKRGGGENRSMCLTNDYDKDIDINIVAEDHLENPLDDNRQADDNLDLEEKRKVKKRNLEASLSIIQNKHNDVHVPSAEFGHAQKLEKKKSQAVSILQSLKRWRKETKKDQRHTKSMENTIPQTMITDEQVEDSLEDNRQFVKQKNENGFSSRKIVLALRAKDSSKEENMKESRIREKSSENGISSVKIVVALRANSASKIKVTK